MTTTTLTIDSETYVRKGVSQPGMTTVEWAAEFHRLGGERSTVTHCAPYRQGAMALHFAGTDEALDFVRASVVEIA